MMNEEIMKLARESGWDIAGIHMPIEQKLEAFYRAAYNKAIEDAALVCEEVGHKEYPIKLVTDGFVEAIRALEMKCQTYQHNYAL